MPDTLNVAPVGEKPTVQMSTFLAWTLLLLASLFWAGSSIAGRLAVGQVPPMALAFWRWCIAFLAFLPFTAIPLWRHRALLLKHWKITVVLAALGIFGFSAPYYLGLRYTTALNASLFNAVSPILIVLIAFVWLKARVTPIQLVGILIGFAGTVVIAVEGDWRLLVTLGFNPGDLLILLGYVSWALFTVLLRWAPKELPSLELTCALAGIGTLMFVPLYALEVDGLGFALTTGNIAIVLYSAIFPSFLAYLFWTKGVAAVGMHQAGYSQYLVPPFGIVLATMMLGEAFRLYHVVAIAMIFAGVWLATRRPAEAR